MVCARVNSDFVGTLVSRIGGGSGVGFHPFVVHPPSCRGGRFHTTALKGDPGYCVCLLATVAKLYQSE